MSEELEALRKVVENAGEAWSDGEHIDIVTPPTVLDLLSRLEQAERNADTYQKLYEQRAESLEQDEQAVDRKQRALDTLARIIEMQQDAVILATDSQDLIGEDGDGDWDAVWDRVRELGEGKRNAEQAVQRVREMHSVIPVKVNFDEFTTDYCDFCGDQEYPCPTIRALDGDTRA